MVLKAIILPNASKNCIFLTRLSVKFHFILRIIAVLPGVRVINNSLPDFITKRTNIGLQIKIPLYSWENAI